MIQLKINNMDHKAILTVPADYERVILALWTIGLDLEPGTYTVTETDGAYKYWVNDPNPTRTVTVKANETATVTFTNQWRGQAQIVKTTTNGGTVAGWHFTVKNSSGTVIGNYETDSTNDGSTSNHVEVLYGIDKVKGAEFLKTIGLENGNGRYENADKTDKLDASKFYYQSDVLINALNAALEANATVVKNAMEAYVKANGGISMPLTDSYGKTSVSGLELGL